MRSLLFVLLAGSSLVACGDDAPSTPDAKVFMDAPIDTMAPCLAPATIPAGGFGTSAMRITDDWFDMPTSGPLMGRTVFSIRAALPSSTATVQDQLIVSVIKPMAAAFTTGSAIPFGTDPTAPSEAYSFLLGDVSMTANGQTLWANTGAVTLTNIGTGDGAMITGSVGATTYREINDSTGADVPGGCTSSLASLSFALTQMAPAMPFAPEKPSDGSLIRMTPEMKAHALSRLERLLALRGQQ